MAKCFRPYAGLKRLCGLSFGGCSVPPPHPRLLLLYSSSPMAPQELVPAAPEELVPTCGNPICGDGNSDFDFFTSAEKNKKKFSFENKEDSQQLFFI